MTCLVADEVIRESRNCEGDCGYGSIDIEEWIKNDPELAKELDCKFSDFVLVLVHNSTVQVCILFRLIFSQPQTMRLRAKSKFLFSFTSFHKPQMAGNYSVLVQLIKICY